MHILKRAIASGALLCALGAAAIGAEYMEKTDFQKSRAFSPGVITEGGRIVWLAGQTATRDEAGNEGASSPTEFKLPERVFVKPLARALIEQRRNLALDGDTQATVLKALEALNHGWW